jgi:hypothetical protein
LQISPFWHFSWPIARFGGIVEDLAKFAAILARLVAVDADIKVLTVIGIGVAWMRNGDALIHLWTREVKDI